MCLALTHACVALRLAVRFLFETSGALGGQPELVVQPFTARAARNDYEVFFGSRVASSLGGLRPSPSPDSMGVTRSYSQPRCGILVLIRNFRVTEGIRRVASTNDGAACDTSEIGAYPTIAEIQAIDTTLEIIFGSSDDQLIM